MSRQEATDILMAEREGGVFLVRDSATIQGDYVLCVRYDKINVFASKIFFYLKFDYLTENSRHYTQKLFMLLI